MSTPEFKGWFAGVGSRDTPEDVCKLMQKLAVVFYALGYGLSSGDARGADRAFWEGALLSPFYRKIGARIYLCDEWVRGRKADPKNFFYNAQRFPTFEKAKQMALEARGSFHGLDDWGINLHSRNVMQIHGASLQDKVEYLVYWAIPVGKTERVKGGTNTSLQLAIKAGIEHRINLYTTEGQVWASQFLNTPIAQEALRDAELSA